MFLLQHLLRNSARLYPDKEAVVFGEESISYKALDDITDKLAGVLQNHGVQKGDRVGIYINKSITSIIALHGILKAGAVYVPLDPNAPASRLTYIIQNCDIKCLLTSTKKIRAVKEMYPESCPLDTIVFTDSAVEVNDEFGCKIVSWQEVEKSAAAPPDNPAIETDLAYILYTSGSTGVPKGVMISHLNALTFVNWAFDTINVTAEDRVSNHAPLHFDLSIFDIFVSFKGGATLFPVPEGLSTFPVRLAEWIEQNRISVWYSVPSILSMLLLHGELDRFKFKNLRTIIFAGEVFPVKYLRDLMRTIPSPEYYNFYGPTETNVITYYKVPQLSPEQTKPIPIGITCENMAVFALTDDGKIVTQPGETGELLARGSCVAYGYWGDREKTNRSFVTNPLQSNFEEKAYKTGDIVTLDEEGNYLFIGRRDHMIKSRGYRIELGEIETVIYTHPDVKEAAVIPIPDELIGNRIKVFVAAGKNGKLIDANELQDFCSKRLPKYMVPDMIEFCDTLPKTSTGKINKPLLIKQST